VSSAKPEIFERIFTKLWNSATNALSRSIVTLADVQEAIREQYVAHRRSVLSDRNPANFFKDFIRNRRSANANWPISIKARGYTSVILCCEAKGRRDDILEDQALRQAKAVFQMDGVTQDIVIPIVAKAFAPSKIFIVEFASITRAEAEMTNMLTVASKAVYELLPPVPGIGR